MGVVATLADYPTLCWKGILVHISRNKGTSILNFVSNSGLRKNVATACRRLQIMAELFSFTDNCWQFLTIIVHFFIQHYECDAAHYFGLLAIANFFCARLVVVRVALVWQHSRAGIWQEVSKLHLCICRLTHAITSCCLRFSMKIALWVSVGDNIVKE